jgi:predicted PurR-regulated permease PerM
MTNMSKDSGSFLTKSAVIIGLATTAVIVLYLLGHLAQMLLIVFGGVLFGVFLDGLTGFISTRFRLPRPISLTAVIGSLVVVLGALALFAGPRLADQFSRLTDRIPAALEYIQSLLSSHDWGQSVINAVVSANRDLPTSPYVLGQVSGIFSSALGAVSAVLIVSFIGIYLAADPDLYTRNVKVLLPRRHQALATSVLSSIGTALRWWLAGRFASMVVVGVLTSIGLWIAGIPLALTLGLIAALFSFVPFIGPIASSIPAILVALAEDPLLVIWVIVVYSVVQLLESYLITPIIQQRAVHIPPALLITVEVLMAVLFGILGILLATPLAVVGIVMVQMLYIEQVLGKEVSVMGKH